MYTTNTHTHVCVHVHNAHAMTSIKYKSEKKILIHLDTMKNLIPMHLKMVFRSANRFPERLDF